MRPSSGPLRPKFRRSPNIRAFLLTGGIVGLIAGLLLNEFSAEDPRYGGMTAFMFFGLACAGLGVLLAGLVAVLLDRR